MSINEKAEAVCRHVWSLDGFAVDSSLSETEDHVGAIIVDAILQSGINYLQVVEPRVRRFREQHPEARTTSGFLDLIAQQDLSELINWRGSVKLERIGNLTAFFEKEGIETRGDLKSWLLQFGSSERLKELKGIGDMTADYLKMLAGIEVCAADSLTVGFLRDAGVDPSSYEEARDILCRMSRMMDVHPVALGFTIWRYIASRRRK